MLGLKARCLLRLLICCIYLIIKVTIIEKRLFLGGRETLHSNLEVKVFHPEHRKYGNSHLIQSEGEKHQFLKISLKNAHVDCAKII